MSVLTDLFTSIANAIRSKTGSQATIQASDFPTEIENIQSGGIKFYANTTGGFSQFVEEISETIPFQNTTSLNSMFKGWAKLKKISDLITTNVTNMRDMFIDCTLLESIKLFDTSKVTNAGYMFDNCSKLTQLPLFDFHSLTNGEFMFYNCNHLTQLPQFNFSSLANAQGMFRSCTRLADFPLLNLASLTNMTNMFTSCNALTSDSLNNILASLLTATGYAGTKTLKYIGLSSTQATTCTTLSNWQALSDAGWTTGY